MIAIIDYGMGNLKSVQKAFEYIGQNAEITTDKEFIKNSDKIVLPGVGAFEQAIEKITSSGMDKLISDEIEKGKPFLGICLGMQMLYEYSLEDGKHKGLGVIKGGIEKFEGDYKIPHIGWNNIDIKKDTLFSGLKDPMVYFVHSYYAKVGRDTSAVCRYAGVEFSASIEKDNLFLTQFHPEKSGDIGLQILKNFIKRKL